MFHLIKIFLTFSVTFIFTTSVFAADWIYYPDYDSTLHVVSGDLCGDKLYGNNGRRGKKNSDYSPKKLRPFGTLSGSSDSYTCEGLYGNSGKKIHDRGDEFYLQVEFAFNVTTYEQPEKDGWGEDTDKGDDWYTLTSAFDPTPDDYYDWVINYNVSPAGLDLTGQNFSDYDLSGLNFNGAILTIANLSGAILTGAKIINANLTNANLIDADLSDANLSGAILIDATLTGAKIINANLTNANLANVWGPGVFTGGADFTDANLTNAYFANNNLTNTTLCNTTMPDRSTNNDDC